MTNDEAAKMVEALASEKPWCDQIWARCALAIAARALRRGRLLTEDEKFENLMSALHEDDEAPHP